ncbi:uncharacterized protein LOC125675432 [Ostrea edulis]|uniref:uncharacterized protein LOC125675432 n=1 Tax=Ostrea edulis TaxID=37623 RepID=UPI0020957C79|nr:uncharacterized protein LOC125675432 [Ostrea edulis]XP_056016552.1 uncharacterized protein LOC125675432 [Ostrea edulis]
MFWTLTVWWTLLTVASASTPFDALNIHRPHVDVIAEQDGNLTLLSGYNGNIRIAPGANKTGSVYFDGEDLFYLIQLIVSLPPVWEDHSPFGYVGEFHSGQKVNIQLRASDPEGTKLTYYLVSGELPPGIKLDSVRGTLKGLAPNTEELYTFTIRAFDEHGKHADNVFKMLIRGANKCDSNPCIHEGRCEEIRGSYTCHCAHPYGGRTCNLDCRSNSLGVIQSKRWIPDAQMTAHKSNGNSYAYNGRQNYGGYWTGVDKSSWLQVDLGNTTRVYGTVMQYYGTRYYTSSYYLQYSTDGNNFNNYTVGGHLTTFSAGASTYTRPLPEPMDARFVRFMPLGWYSSYGPYMRVDILGCHYYTL